MPDRIVFAAACAVEWLLDRFSPGRREGPDLRGPVEIDQAGAIAVVLHFAKLAAEDRFHRFNGRMSLAALVGRYAGPDGRRGTFLGYLSGSRIVALAELSAFGDPELGEETELGVSVLAAWQRKGLGEALLREALDRVRQRAGGDLVLYIAPDNARMIRLAHRLGGRREPGEGGDRYVFRSGPDATPSKDPRPPAGG